MEDLTKVFGTVEPVAAAPEVANVAEKKATKLDAEIQKAFKATADAMEAQGRDIFAESGKNSNDLLVVNTLSYSDVGGLVADHSAEAAGKQRQLVAVPEIVGYNVQNIGKEPINYAMELWTKDENGVYVPTMTNLVLQPGETAAFTRKALSMLTAEIQYSFTLANGKMIPRVAGDLEKILSSTYFKFDDPDKGVHDDTVKLAIADKVGDKWVIRPEYESTFGFLNNEKPKAPTAKRAASRKASRQALVANYVRGLLEQSK